jgi:hypothetical protein
MTTTYVKHILERKLIDTIMEVSKECAEPNWDGYGAAPVSEESVNYAVRFVLLFPAWIPEPEVTADNDGCIALDWQIASGKVISVSFYKNGYIDYAGLHDENKICGCERMGDTFPKHIADFIKGIYEMEN